MPNTNMPSHGTSAFKLINFLLDKLFSAEKRRLQKTTKELVLENNERTGCQFAGFLFNGVYYTTPDFRTSPGTKKITLDPNLTERMEWHIKDAETVQEDEQFVNQFLYQLMRNAESLQELRDTFPDCIAQMVPALASLPRIGEVGCTLKKDSPAWRTFPKMLQKVEFYSAARLLY